jgi:hypothetical protein
LESKLIIFVEFSGLKSKANIFNRQFIRPYGLPLVALKPSYSKVEGNDVMKIQFTIHALTYVSSLKIAEATCLKS